MKTTTVESEIAGTIIKIEKQSGDEVDVDDIIALVECMKMEIPILAPTAGRIAIVGVKEGQTIGEGHAVATIETRDG